MKLILMFVLLALATATKVARAEDYQCGSDAGCEARITENGEVKDVTFRKGDMVSTDAGWSVSTDDGWVKVKTYAGPPRRCRCGRWHLSMHGGAGGGAVLAGYLMVRAPLSVPMGPAVGVPKVHASWARAHAPAKIALVGV